MNLPPKNTPITSTELIEYCIKFGGLEKEIQSLLESPPKKPFVFDGASCYPEWANEILNLDEMAFRHDVKYYIGGTSKQRLIADAYMIIDAIELCGCTIEQAMFLFNMVRIGGSEKFDTSWKWGNGWD